MDPYCTLIIEELLKSNMHFDSRYLEFINAWLLLVNILLNMRNGIEFQYHSISLLSIFDLSTDPILPNTVSRLFVSPGLGQNC